MSSTPHLLVLFIYFSSSRQAHTSTLLRKNIASFFYLLRFTGAYYLKLLGIYNSLVCPSLPPSFTTLNHPQHPQRRRESLFRYPPPSLPPFLSPFLPPSSLATRRSSSRRLPSPNRGLPPQGAGREGGGGRGSRGFVGSGGGDGGYIDRTPLPSPSLSPSLPLYLPMRQKPTVRRRDRLDFLRLPLPHPHQ